MTEDWPKVRKVLKRTNDCILRAGHTLRRLNTSLIQSKNAFKDVDLHFAISETFRDLSVVFKRIEVFTKKHCKNGTMDKNWMKRKKDLLICFENAMEKFSSVSKKIIEVTNKEDIKN